MTGSINAEYIEVKDRLKDLITLSEEVGLYVNLRRSTEGFIGNCPFHKDGDSSFWVGDDEKEFKCYKCQVGGDVFVFLKEYCNMAFLEAVQYLSQKLHITIPEIKSEESEEITIPHVAQKLMPPWFQKEMFQTKSFAVHLRDGTVCLCKKIVKLIKCGFELTMVVELLDHIPVGMAPFKINYAPNGGRNAFVRVSGIVMCYELKEFKNDNYYVV